MIRGLKVKRGLKFDVWDNKLYGLKTNLRGLIGDKF